MSTFTEIVRLNIPIKLESTGYGHLKMINHPVPYSIKEREFHYLQQVIEINELKRGLEIGTGLGIATLALSMGFKTTEGKLISIDSYQEEQLSSIHSTDGCIVAKYLLNHYGTSNHVELFVDFSPTSIATLIKNNFGEQKLDFVLIDGEHKESSIMADIKAVIPFLDSPSFLFIANVYDYYITPEIRDYIKSIFNQDITIGVAHPDGENLGFVIKE